MATFTKKIQKYVLFQYPNRQDGPNRINLYLDGNYRLYVCFLPADVELPDNAYSEPVGIAYEREHRYPNYVDALRNEGPLWVTFRTDQKRFVVYSADEPVGEGEGAL